MQSKRTAMAIWLGSAVLCAGALGCNKERSDAAQRPMSPSAEEPSTTTAVQAPKERYDETSFALELAPRGEYKAGEPGEVAVVLTAKEPYKCNDKYPYKLKLENAEGINLPAQVLNKDALELEKQKAVMRVKFTPEAAGTRRIAGEFSFSVCTDDKCLVEKRKLALDVVVR